MEIEDIKKMSREHLEDLVEYLIRQQTTHINVAPQHFSADRARAWVKGFDYSREKLIEMAKDYELLKDHLPAKWQHQARRR